MDSTRSEKGYRKALYRVDSADSKDFRQKHKKYRVPKMAPQSKKLMNKNFIYNSPSGETSFDKLVNSISMPSLASNSEDADNV